MRNTLLLFICFYALVSCEEVIELDLQDAASTLVIEGKITDQSTSTEVTLSLTGSYYNPQANPYVENAAVSIAKGDGTSIPLTESIPGTYVADELIGEPGQTYTLEVETPDKTYLASSYLNLPIKLDSISYAKSSRSPFADGSGYELSIHFQDPEGDIDYLRIVATVNGEYDTYFLYNGRLADGQSIEFPLFGSSYELDDQVSLQVETIDESTYTYFNTLGDLIGINNGPGAAAPANPASNIDNGALGYFAAFSITKASILIQ